MPSCALTVDPDQTGHWFAGLPEALIGANGTQRGLPTTNSLGADNDVQAILIWLSTKANHTRRAYLLEIRRFLAFMVWIRGRAISSATDGDLEAFRVWLTNPELPTQGWPADYLPFKLMETPPGSGLRRDADRS